MILSLLEKRRSVRKFSSRPVEGEKTDKILQAMLRSPSSRGLNPWEFVLVTEREPLEELSRAKEHGSAFLAGVPLAIVVCADP
ncbi:nitroreductase family protein [Desulfuromonas sp.]|nr:nitroreductase family protein [Desulfuromonas sp.]